MASASTQARARVKSVLQAEFAAEGIIVHDDRMHGSLGQGQLVASTSPIAEYADPDNANTLIADTLVQFFNAWRPDIDPTQQVDPSTIEGLAHRFKIAVQDDRTVNDPYCWYLRVVRIDYAPDPTGNITRFLAQVRAWGNNDAEI